MDFQWPHGDCELSCAFGSCIGGSESPREIADDQIGEGNQEKLAQAVVFWPIHQRL